MPRRPGAAFLPRCAVLARCVAKHIGLAIITRPKHPTPHPRCRQPRPAAASPRGQRPQRCRAPGSPGKAAPTGLNPISVPGAGSASMAFIVRGHKSPLGREVSSSAFAERLDCFPPLLLCSEIKLATAAEGASDAAFVCAGAASVPAVPSGESDPGIYKKGHSPHPACLLPQLSLSAQPGAVGGSGDAPGAQPSASAPRFGKSSPGAREDAPGTPLCPVPVAQGTPAASPGLEMGFPYPTPSLPVLLSQGIHHDHPPQHFLVMHQGRALLGGMRTSIW